MNSSLKEKNKIFFVFKITNENPLKIHNVYKSKAYFEGKEKELEIPKVDYLQFVDSDDTLSLDNVEECMKRVGKDIDIVWFHQGYVQNRLKLNDELVLTLDLPTSKLANGNIAHTGLVNIEKYQGDLPEISAFDAPKGAL